jgi:DNA ligase (NAD+)
MLDLQLLEAKYLDAKVAYYSGTPILSDAEFDALEEVLKKENSLVIRQVGTKRGEFDYPHPSPMLSLNKIQTEKLLNDIDFKETELIKWVDSKCKILNISSKNILFEFSPKYDGNAINVIHVGGKLHKILSRSDQNYGKDLTEKLREHIPNIIPQLDLTDILETRYEAVLEKEIFNKKYLSENYANPRNIVAGILGRDEKSNDLNDISLQPVCRLLNSKNISIPENNDFFYDYIYNYKTILQEWINKRDSFKYQLDGIVISFPIEYREKLGVNDHDPEWSIAIKFIPDVATTTINDIKWFVGKTGELTPVGLLNPVILAGTTVQRVSLYNLGYVVKNNLGSGAMISLAKAGDIIPEIQTIISPATDNLNIPINCPSCGKELVTNDIHLVCVNNQCKERLVGLLNYQMKLLKLKRVGEKTIEIFAEKGFDIVNLIYYVRKFGNTKDIEKFGFKFRSRSLEIFYNAFISIQSIDYDLIPIFLGIENVGRKISKQIMNYYLNESYDFSHHERNLIELFKTKEIKEKVFDIIKLLEETGINIIYPNKNIMQDKKVTFAELTGSPKNAGWKTKEEFKSEMNVEEYSLSSPQCEYLITDSYESTSSKMKVAKQKGIKIITYSDFKRNKNV